MNLTSQLFNDAVALARMQAHESLDRVRRKLNDDYDMPRDDMDELVDGFIEDVFSNLKRYLVSK